ncbi:hypothetical protein BJV77DRAFT_1065556 [Russula vinacea]|nr:hypothetical protein BJV77DRAFT_1065556 [Russula vinacea]
MSTTQSSVWERKAAVEEAQYARQKEQEQLASLARSEAKTEQTEPPCVPREDRDYEAGFGGQEDLEDRYATTSGEH